VSAERLEEEVIRLVGGDAGRSLGCLAGGCLAGLGTGFDWAA
jgi:hypothetical protein